MTTGTTQLPWYSRWTHCHGTRALLVPMVYVLHTYKCTTSYVPYGTMAYHGTRDVRTMVLEYVPLYVYNVRTILNTRVYVRTNGTYETVRESTTECGDTA